MRTNQFLASSVGLVATVSAQSSSQGSYQASGIPICAQHTATGTAEVAAAAATALTESPTSNKEGRAFNRIAQIYLETTAFENAVADGTVTKPFTRSARADTAL